MYRILLADDEPIILSGLQTYLPWEECNCSVVGTARNGIQLMEKIRQLSPDIILCDVTMPLSSGLEVLDLASKEYPEIVFIMLTNYSDFSLVQNALRNKATDYLLKIDLTAEILKVSLDRAIEERERRRKLHQLDEYEHRLKQAEAARAEEERKKEIMRWVTRLLESEGGDPEWAAQELSCLEAAERSALVEIHMSSSSASPAFTPEEQLQQQSFHNNLIKDMAEKMYYHGDYVLIDRETKLWLYLWNLENPDSLEQFHSRLNTALGDVTMQQVHFLVTEILPAGRLKEMRTQLTALHRKYAASPLCPLLYYSPSSEKGSYVSEAIRFVEQHIMDRISIQEVASVIGITPNYLSSLFKRQLGKNFVDYVNEQKLERACVLLRSGEFKISNISHMLGYENAYYFAKVFKKYMHMTPTEWQTQNRQE